MNRARLHVAILGFTVGAAAALRAQPAPSTMPAGSASPMQRAMQFATQGDTTSAVALLDSAVRVNKIDGPAWHLLGLIRWEQARRARNPNYMKDQRAIRLLMGADSALRLATQFAPDSARYWMSLSRFNLQSGVSTMRFAASGEVSNAVDAATKTGDAILLATALDEQGMFAWRRYEAVANRAFTNDNQRIQIEQTTNWPRDKALDFVKSIAAKIEPPTGTADYTEAFNRFTRAVSLDSTSLRASRHLYMALAERNRWPELLSIADRRATQFPLDYQARLARGLALHRLSRGAESRAAFDSALVMMDEDERDRLTRFTRILRPQATSASRAAGGDSAAYSKLPEGQRRGLEEMYWFMNDPLTLTNENEYRLEFLSRVVFADFRWTDEDQNLRGADTDRGDIYVRYGPPDYEITTPGGTWQPGGVTLVWSYKAGFTFFFDIIPGFGTSRLARNDRDNAEQIRNTVPVAWTNLASTVVIDTIPVRVTRFRAGRDSSDAIVAAAFPIDSLVRGLAVDRVPVDLDFRVFDQFVRVRGVESTQIGVAPDSGGAPIARTWTRRLGPGLNVVRVEAFQADSKRAARAMSRLEPFVTNGFGMSDLLIGSRPAPRDPARQPTSWRDLEVAPSTGEIPRGSPLGLVWELYEADGASGAVRYKVSISVQPVEKRGALGFGVKVLDGLGRAVTRSGERGGRFTISFDRTAPAARTIVDHLTLDLGEAPAGAYLLRVEITDSVSQKRVARETPFGIR